MTEAIPAANEATLRIGQRPATRRTPTPYRATDAIAGTSTDGLSVQRETSNVDSDGALTAGLPR